MTSSINYTIKCSKNGIPTKQFSPLWGNSPISVKIDSTLNGVSILSKNGGIQNLKTVKEIAGRLKARKSNQVFEETRESLQKSMSYHFTKC